MKELFKYELRRSKGSIFTCIDLTWIERMKYRLRGFKVIKLD